MSNSITNGAAHVAIEMAAAERERPDRARLIAAGIRADPEFFSDLLRLAETLLLALPSVLGPLIPFAKQAASVLEEAHALKKRGFAELLVS